MRLGLFGGSFDPVHLGHLLVAETCRDQVGLDEIWFVPAAIPPHKRSRELAPDRQRLEMLELAVAGHEAFHVSSMELDRGGVSYTVDTLRELSARRPEAEFYLLLGADSLRDLPTWREPAEICRLATPLVVARGGEPPVDMSVLAPLMDAERLHKAKQSLVRMPVLEISSTSIRADVAAGRSIRYRVPRAVEQYIAQHGLYREE